jgi:xylono-1,5-lactonase
MAALKQHTARLLTASTRAVLGEGPVWDERTQTLYWVDIERGALHQCRADGSGEAAVLVGQRLGCVALRRDQPGFVAGLERSIALITLEPLRIETVATLDSQPVRNRCNDGKCDPAGRFWLGTYDTGGEIADGWLFRFDGRALPQPVAGPFICVNGPAFSPDGNTLYCVDSYGRAVYRYRLGPSGELSGPSLFRSFQEPGWGYPDGLTCDAEGCVWIAHWGASRVSRFSPAGELLEVVTLPVLQPSSCSFGGPQLRQLFITSAAVGLTGAANVNGLAGAVFVSDLEVCGLPAARYRG